MRRLADIAFRRRGRMVLAWVLALVAIAALSPTIAGEFDADYSTPNSESAAASDLVRERFPGRSAEGVDVVVRAREGVRDAAVQARVDRFVDRAVRLEGIGERQPGDRVSRDGTIGLTQLSLTRDSWDVPVETGEELIAAAERASGDGVRIELGGGVVQQAQEGASPETVGLFAAAIILLVAFGSVVAAGLPLVTALFGLGISSSLIGVAAALLDVPDWSMAVAGLVGIGVGIDYALLIVTRFRSALAGGADRHDAVAESLATAGRSVLVAGTTVIISLFGLFLMGVSYLHGVAVAASLAVLVVMAASVTLLPALLAYAGPRVDRFHVPGLGRALEPGAATPALRWSRTVQRRPWAAAIAGMAVLLALAAPALGLRLGFPDAGNDREGTTTRAAYELVAQGFGPGANGPLLLVAEREGADLRPLVERVRQEPGVAFVAPAGDPGILAVAPRTSPQDEATADLVERLRDDVVPAGVLVGGMTASFLDQSDLVAERLPLFVAGVVGLSFLLLLVAFRSPLIALKAGFMNLLSVGAAYGVIALVAQGGAVGELIGIDTETPIAPFIPVMMFAILFGLSMDYEVFLLSRVREEFLGHRETSRAVADALAKTARVITAAAAIMVVVFLAFLASDEVFLKLMGVGMAAAILVDATIVRMVLVPAVMQLLGRANWWIPRWLDRALPRFEPEPAKAPG
jgi:putative drug exporter of the RND superfamily